MESIVKDVAFKELYPGYVYQINDPFEGIERETGICIDIDSSNGAYFVLVEKQKSIQLFPHMGQKFYLLKRSNSETINNQIDEIVNRLNRIREENTAKVFCEADASQSIERDEDEESMKSFLLEPCFPAAIFNSVPYILKRKPTSRIALELLVYAIAYCTNSDNEKYAQFPLFPYLVDQESLIDSEITNDTENIAILRRFGRIIRQQVKWDALYRGDIRFTGIVTSWNTTNKKGYISVLPSLSIPFTGESIIDDRLFSILSNTPVEAGHPEVEFTICKTPSGTFPARIIPTKQTLRVLTNLWDQSNGRQDDSLSINLMRRDGSRDYEPVPTSDLQSVYKKILNWKNIKQEWEPYTTRHGQITSISRIEKTKEEVLFTGIITCNSCKYFFHSNQILDSRVLEKIESNSALDIEVDFEIAFNPSRRLNISPCADWIRFKDMSISSYNDLVYDSFNQSILRRERLQKLRAENNVNSLFRPLQPWLRVYESLFNEKVMGHLVINSSYPCQYYIQTNDGKKYPFRITQVWDEFLFRALSSPASTQIDWESVPLIGLIVREDPSRAEKMLADQVLLTGVGRKKLQEQTNFDISNNGDDLYLFVPRKDFLPQPLLQSEKTINYAEYDLIRSDDNQTRSYGHIASYFSIGRKGTIQLDDDTLNAKVSFSVDQIYDKRLLKIIELQGYQQLQVQFVLCFDEEGVLLADKIEITEDKKNDNILKEFGIDNARSDNNEEYISLKEQIIEKEDDRTAAVDEIHSTQGQVNFNFSKEVCNVEQESPSLFWGVISNQLHKGYYLVYLEKPFRFLPEKKTDQATDLVDRIVLNTSSDRAAVKDNDLRRILQDIPLGVLSKRIHISFQIMEWVDNGKYRFNAFNAILSPEERAERKLTEEYTISPQWGSSFYNNRVLTDSDITNSSSPYSATGWIVDATTGFNDDWYLTIALRKPLLYKIGNQVYLFSHVTTSTSPSNWKNREALRELNEKLNSIARRGTISFQKPIKIGFLLKQPRVFDTRALDKKVKLYAFNVATENENQMTTQQSDVIYYSDVLRESFYYHTGIATCEGTNWKISDSSSALEYQLTISNCIDEKIVSAIKIPNTEKRINVRFCLNSNNMAIGVMESELVQSPLPVRFAQTLESTSNIASVPSIEKKLELPEINGFPAIEHPFIKSEVEEAYEWKEFQENKTKENLEKALFLTMRHHFSSQDKYRSLAYLAWLLWFDESIRPGLRSLMSFAANTSVPKNIPSKMSSLKDLHTPWPTPSDQDAMTLLAFLFRLPPDVEYFSSSELEGYVEWRELLRKFKQGATIESIREKIQILLSDLYKLINSYFLENGEVHHETHSIKEDALSAAEKYLFPEERNIANKYINLMQDLSAYNELRYVGEKKAFLLNVYKRCYDLLKETIENPSIVGTEIINPALQKISQAIRNEYEKVSAEDTPVFDVTGKCEVLSASNSIRVQISVVMDQQSPHAYNLAIKLDTKQNDPCFADEEGILSFNIEEPVIAEIDVLTPNQECPTANWFSFLRDGKSISELRKFKLKILISYQYDTIDRRVSVNNFEKEIDILPEVNCGKISLDFVNAMEVSRGQENPVLVFGRDDTLNLLEKDVWDDQSGNYIASNIAIFGQRRIGKSTIARQLIRRLREKTIDSRPALILDLINISNYANPTTNTFDFDGLMKEIYHALYAEVPQHLKAELTGALALAETKGASGWTDFYHALHNVHINAGLGMPHVFITLDEFTTLYAPLRQHSEYRSYVASLLTLSDNSPVTLIIVALDHYPSMRQYFEQSRQHIKEYLIEGIGEKGAQLLMTTAKTETGQEFKLISAKQAMRLCGLMDSHPLLLINALKVLVAYLNNKHIYTLLTDEEFDEYIQLLTAEADNFGDYFFPLYEDGRLGVSGPVTEMFWRLNLITMNMLSKGCSTEEILERLREESLKTDIYGLSNELQQFIKALENEHISIPDHIIHQFKRSKAESQYEITPSNIIKWLTERKVLRYDALGSLSLAVPFYKVFYLANEEFINEVYVDTEE